MTMRIARLAGALGCLGMTACAGATSPQSTENTFAPSPAREAVRRTSNATVIKREMFAGRGGSVLSAMRYRVTGMQVKPSGGCPSILLRGQRSFVAASNPQVYVNGARSNDTCILEMTQAADVERVEVYPMGVTNRPGYQAHPHGLILVFLRGAES